MFFYSIVCFPFFSMFIPYVIKILYYNDWSINLSQLFITLFFDIIIFTLSALIITFIGIIIVICIGLIISCILSRIIFRIKSINIKKTICFHKIRKFCITNKFKEKVYIFKLYPNKIELNDNFIKTIFFSALGYSGLNVISQFALVDLIRRSIDFSLFVDEILFNDENSGVIIVVNAELYRKMKDINKRIMKQKKEKYFKVHPDERNTLVYDEDC